MVNIPGTSITVSEDKIRNRTFLVTGATGLVGSCFVKCLLKMNEADGLSMKVIAPVRSLDKAKKVYGDSFNSEYLKFVEIESIENDLKIDEPVNYVLHGANPTASLYFVNNPVETITTAVLGTKRMLELAREKNVEGFIYLSTMEVYGDSHNGERITESDLGTFDPTVARNSYPLSKLMCENLCCSYCKEYGLPVHVARLTQTFGPGVEYSDKRVFAEFARCAIEKKNIVLKTKGETERSYLYTDDAVSALLLIMVNGADGEVYTVANEATYCSIYEMAQLVAQDNGIEVVIEETDITKFGYANTLHMNLDTARLQNLGWSAATDLREMFKNLIEYMKQVSEK